MDARKVERAACEEGISIRVGCFCNPGSAEAALEPDIEWPGCVRVSLGVANIDEDVDTFLSFLAGFMERRVFSFAKKRREDVFAGKGEFVGRKQKVLSASGLYRV